MQLDHDQSKIWLLHRELWCRVRHLLSIVPCFTYHRTFTTDEAKVEGLYLRNHGRRPGCRSSRNRQNCNAGRHRIRLIQLRHYREVDHDRNLVSTTLFLPTAQVKTNWGPGSSLSLGRSRLRDLYSSRLAGRYSYSAVLSSPPVEKPVSQMSPDPSNCPGGRQ